MKHLGLFEGIGGFSLAARWMGWETVAWVEWDKRNQEHLKRHFPNAKGYGDICEFSGKEYRGTVDIITGGFPCQPFSTMGKRKGKEDPRYLWPEMYRVIGEVRPTYSIAENVSGSWELVDEICSDMEVIGYETEPVGIEAASAGADTLRLRYWFISYPKGHGNNKLQIAHSGTQTPQRTNIICERNGRPAPSTQECLESGLRRVLDGVPNRMDRLKQVGNSIDVRVAYEIFKAIEQIK